MNSQKYNKEELYPEDFSEDEKLQFDFVKYETRIKNRANHKKPEIAVKGKAQLVEAVNYKARFATSQQKLNTWLKQQEQQKLIQR